jgi:hypothetical protein
LFLYCGAEWEYIVPFTKVLISIISYINSPSPQLPFLIHGMVSTGIIFVYTYIHTHIFHHIHTSTPFPYCLPLPMVSTLPPCAGLIPPNSFSLILQKGKEKKKNKTFLLI